MARARRRGRPGRGRGGRRRAVVAADDAGRRIDAGRHRDDQRSQPAVRTLGRPHEGPRAAARPCRRAALSRCRSADEHSQGPFSSGRLTAQSGVARDRALSVDDRRWSSCACHRRFRPEGKDRCQRGRRAHARAHLRSRRSARRRHPPPGRSVAERPVHLPADPQAMSARCFLRRTAAFAALGGLIAAIPIQARSQQAQAVSGSEVVRLLNAGRTVYAAQLANRFAATAPLPQRQPAFPLAAQTCVTAMDVDCARAVLTTAAPYLQSLPASELQQPSLGYVVLLKSFFQVMTGDYQATFSGPGFPNPLASAISNPVLIADLYLLAAKQSRLVFDFEASRDNLDKALTTTLSLDYERSDAPRLIIRMAAQLLENYEVERAVRLVAAASPILQTIPPDSLLRYEFPQVFNTLAGYRKDFDGLSQGLHVARSRLDQLQLKPALNSYLKSAAYNDLLGAEVLRGDHDAARKLLQSHPLMAAKPAILKRGYFVDANEFNFALVEEFTRLVLKDATETGWGDLMKMSPAWTTDPQKIQEVQPFGQAAVGFQLLRAGKQDEARLEIIEAGKKRLSTLQGRYRKSVYASPLPYWTDQVLLEFALAANLSDATPDD